MAAFHKALGEAGYVEGQNVTIEYRWADNQSERLPALAADLVQRRVSLIAIPGSTMAAVAAKAATTTIPIVFSIGEDPVHVGLVAGLGRPGGNATGVTTMSGELVAKRLGLLHELLPAARLFVAFVNPGNPGAESVVAELNAAAAAIGRPLEILTATTNREIDHAFAGLVQKRADALLMVPGALFTTRRSQILTLAARHAVPAIYAAREFAEGGGLISYGTDFSDAYRQVAVYAARVLKGETPANLPVLRATKFELVINMQTARTLGLDVPPTLLARADDVIE